VVRVGVEIQDTNAGDGSNRVCDARDLLRIATSLKIEEAGFFRI
jgi:hypothetical protein